MYFTVDDICMVTKLVSVLYQYHMALYLGRLKNCAANSFSIFSEVGNSHKKIPGAS